MEKVMSKEKTKKVLILGAAGMLGHVVYLYFKENTDYELITTSNSIRFPEDSFSLDVSDKEKVEAFINKHKPDIVINCIGVLIKGSTNDPSNAIYINAFFPHFLAKLLDNYGGKLIHISTDCVFSGKKGSYSEDDFKDATDFYGMSKSLGEVTYGKHLTIRTSIIGPELKKNGEGLFDWFMRQKGEINGYTEAYWGGVTTLTLANNILLAVENNSSGLFHVTNEEKISKFDLLYLFAQIFNKTDINIVPDATYSIDKSLALKKDSYFFKVPSYDVMLKEMQINMHKQKTLYTKYF